MWLILRLSKGAAKNFGAPGSLQGEARPAEPLIRRLSVLSAAFRLARSLSPISVTNALIVLVWRARSDHRAFYEVVLEVRDAEGKQLNRVSKRQSKRIGNLRNLSVPW